MYMMYSKKFEPIIYLVTLSQILYQYKIYIKLHNQI